MRSSSQLSFLFLLIASCGGASEGSGDAATDACMNEAPPTITSEAATSTCALSGAFTYTLTLDEITSVPAGGITATGGTITSITPALPASSATFEIVVDLSAVTTLTLRAGATGACDVATTTDASVTISPWQPQSMTFAFTGAIVPFTVPAATSSCGFIIEAWGAEGGQHANSTADAGRGARMRGLFTSLPSHELRILAGEQPNATEGNGGGGGSFVVTAANEPVVIAGGGGGSGESADGAYKHGHVGTEGQSCPAGGGTGGQAGNGGGVGSTGIQSAAGGGLLTGGANGADVLAGGASFLAGGAGGAGNAPANGGFGGGGSGSSSALGGGGGGYSGGAGCSASGSPTVGAGGGSYNVAPMQDNETGAREGHGQVVIRW